MASMKINPDARALEDAFFAEENARLLEQLRAKTERKERRQALSELVRIQDEDYLDHLIDLGIGPETILALTLVPLTAVAWADGEMNDSERRAILRAAEQKGIEPDSEAHRLLEAWLERKPGPHLLETWKRYVSAIWGSFSEVERREMRWHGMELARDVAKAAGGFLGINKISPAERAVLDELEKIFP